MIIDLLSYLDGKRTYLLSFAAGIVLALRMSGLIDEAVANQILAVMGVTGMATLRAGVAKAERAANGDRL
jgi:hypothetical protein